MCPIWFWNSSSWERGNSGLGSGTVQKYVFIKSIVIKLTQKNFSIIFCMDSTKTFSKLCCNNFSKKVFIFV